ncbi:MAG: ABC transporter permease [Sandaracinaceae bacterium]|nr:ABC transporter permease [Sandaracinaceae bacterium]
MRWLGGLYSQLRVMQALALRETRTRFGNHQLGYVWALLEPLVWIGTFWGMFHLANKAPPTGMDMVTFLATGVIPYDIFSKTTDRCAAAIDANKGLLFYPQVHPLDIVFARAGLEFATYFVVLIVILGGNALVTGEFAIEDPLMVAQGLALASLLGTSLGLVFAAMSVENNLIDRVRGPLMRPLFWTSGIFFTLNSLPLAAREVMLWNPVLHCVEFVRSGFFESYHGQYMSGRYVLLWVLGFTFVGLTIERAVRHKVEVT